MKRVLITGMSGTGKTSVIQELAARGYQAYDLDTPEWSEWIDADPPDVLTPSQGKDWVWREDRVHALLSAPGDGKLFISGCAENMAQLFALIDAVILLSAPVATIMERLAQRSAGSYGDTAEERGRLPISSQPSSRCSGNLLTARSIRGGRSMPQSMSNSSDHVARMARSRKQSNADAALWRPAPR